MAKGHQFDVLGIRSTAADRADKIKTHALSLYRGQEDTSRGVVAGPGGVEPYLDYRRRLAERYRAAAEDAEAVVNRLEQKGDETA